MRIVFLKGVGLSKVSRLRRCLSCVRGGLGGLARGRAIIFTIIIKAPLGFQEPEVGRGDGKPG